MRIRNTDFCYGGEDGVWKEEEGVRQIFFSSCSNHIWVKGSSERMQFAACMERFNYCLIIDWKIRGRQCEVRRTKIKLSYGFLSVIEDGRFEKEIGWNVVKEDFKVGENGEGGERGGGLILG